jgi:hypothetical protein
MVLKGSTFVTACIVMGVLLAACGAGSLPTGQSNAPLIPQAERVTTTTSSTLTPLFLTATSTPVWALFPPAKNTEALYQSFEHGFMVWRSNANCVYALVPNEDPPNTLWAVIPSGFSSYSYCLAVDPLPTERVITTPPSGLLLPTGVLGQVWSFYPDVQEALGYALQTQSSYLSTIPVMTALPVYDGLAWSFRQIALPDGRILSCGARAATAGMCFLDQKPENNN